MPDLPVVVEFVAGYAAGKALDPMLDPAVRRVLAAIDRAKAKALAFGREPNVDERTARAVIDAASATDDSIVSDYLGGVLAASTGDDAGTPVAALIGRLSSFDLRLHYTLYRTYQPFIELAVNDDGDAAVIDGRVEIARVEYPDIFVPTRELLPALDLGADAAGVMRVEQALGNLGRERLLGQVLHNSWNGSPAEPYLFGRDDLNRWDIEQPEHGLVFAPSANGMSLMAWGLGLEDRSPLSYRDVAVPDTIGDIKLPACPSPVKVSSLPKAAKPEA